jgi:hypothetical protein
MAFEDEPLLLNRLRAREQHKQAQSPFSCLCSVCIKQAAGIKLKTIDPLAEKDEIANYEGQEKSYSWVLEQLGDVAAKVTIKLPVPDVCVFRRGKVAFLLQSGRDRSLKMTTTGEKLSLHNIQKLFTKIVKERKKEDLAWVRGPRKAGSVSTSDPGLNKETAVARCMMRDKTNDDGMQAKDEEGPLRFLSSNEFFQLIFDKRLGDPYWKTISYIQTVVKCRYGVGETLEVVYYSHDSADKQAVQALQDAGESQNDGEEALSQSNPYQYCMLLCRRIAYFLASHCQHELLRFKGEFMKDDNGKLWLTWASRISVRPIQVKQTQGEILFKRVGLITPEGKQRLIDDLETTQEPKGVESPGAERLAQYMQSHYEEIKASTGVNRLFEKDPPDYKTNEAFARLRPMTPYTLEELLDPRIGERLSQRLHDPLSDSHVTTRRVATARFRSRRLFSTATLATPRQFKWVYNPKVRLSKTTSVARC